MTQRRHDIDALRVLAFAVLILYHASGIWQRDSDFHIVSHYQYDWIEWVRIVVNRWRMPLLFVLSGMALALSGLMSSPARSAWTRTWRLLLPLLFGMWTVVSIQAYCAAVAEGTIAPGFLRFWLIYAQAKTSAASAAGAVYGITWNHLWYLAYLWCYTIALLVVAALLRSMSISIRPLRRVPIGIWVCLGITWTAVILIVLQPRFPETHALAGDWFAHAHYLSFYAVGYLCAGSLSFRSWLDRWRWRLIPIAISAITIELGIRAIGRGLIPIGDVSEGILALPWAGIERGARAIYTWGAVLAILAWGQRLLDRPFRWLPWANQSVYPWYILHQTWLVLIAYWVAPLGIGVGWEVLIVVGGTVVGCWVLTDGIIRRNAWLGLLFGLKPLVAAPQSVAPHLPHASRQA